MTTKQAQAPMTTEDACQAIDYFEDLALIEGWVAGEITLYRADVFNTTKYLDWEQVGEIVDADHVDGALQEAIDKPLTECNVISSISAAEWNNGSIRKFDLEPIALDFKVSLKVGKSPVRIVLDLKAEKGWAEANTADKHFLSERAYKLLYDHISIHI